MVVIHENLSLRPVHSLCSVSTLKGILPRCWWGRLCCLCKRGPTNRRLCGFQNFESRHRYTLKGPVAFLDLSLVISFNFLYCCRRNNKAITGRSFKKSKGDISTFGIAQAKSSLILVKNYWAHRQLIVWLSVVTLLFVTILMVLWLVGGLNWIICLILFQILLLSLIFLKK